MPHLPIRRPSPALLLAVLALLLSLGGSAYAAASLPAGSVGTRQLKDGAVTTSKLARGAVTATNVEPGSLVADDFKAGQLQQGAAGTQGPAGPQGPAASVSFYQVTATIAVQANSYDGLGAACVPGATVTGGGLSDTLYFGSSGELLESFPTNSNGIQGWAADVYNGYSQPEQFTVYAICERTNGS